MNTTSQFFQRLALLLGAATLLSTAWAQNQATLTPIGKWPEYPLLTSSSSVRVAGSYAYIAGIGHPAPPAGSAEKATLRLVTLDVSAPSQPRYLTHLDIPTAFSWWNSVRMDVRGDYAYVTLGYDFAPFPGVLEVFDLSQAAAPRLLGTCPFTGCAFDMDVAGHFVFVAAATSSSGRLLILDVTDPAQPVLAKTLYPQGFPGCVSVAGNYLYTGGNVSRAAQPDPILRVNIMDVSDPSRAFAVGGFDIPERGGVSAIAAQGGLLHLGNRLGQNAYQVFAATDPLHPVWLARYEPPFEEPNLIRVVGNLVYWAASRGLRVFDLSDPQNPQERAFLSMGPNTFTWTDYFDIAGQYGYWLDRGELRVLDLKQPAAPVQIGRFDIGFRNPRTCLEGDRAYLFDLDAVRVIDVSNPRAHQLVGAREDLSRGLAQALGYTPDAAFSSFYVKDRRAYAVGYLRADVTSNQTGSLQIFDLSDPVHSQALGFVETPARNTGVDVVGTRAYVTGVVEDWRAGVWQPMLKVFDVGDAAAPVELGSLDLPEQASPPQVVGNFAYLRLGDSFGGDKLAVFDIRDPGQMSEVGRYQFMGGLAAFQVVGRYAYGLVRGSDDKGFTVVDLADPAHPQRVGRYPWEGETLALGRLLVQGRYAFVTLSGDTNRVDILDLVDPTHPLKTGEYQAAREVTDLAIVGNTLYLTSDVGLTALDFYAPNTSPNLRLNAPMLSGGVAVFTWQGGPGIKLQKATSLTAPDWKDVPNTDGQHLIALPPTDTTAFFRLVQP